MENEVQKDNICIIKLLPNEIITMILQNIDYPDIINFGSTCKEFNEMVKNNQFLWKKTFKHMLPIILFNKIDKNNDRNWLGKVKTFCRVKKDVYSVLLKMSPTYYWQNNELSIEDFRRFFCIALSNNLNYYYTVYILQDTVTKGYQNINEFIAKEPFTLTEIFYAKNALRYLMNTYLAVKWIQGYKKKELHPDIVLNFFLQWVDPINMHYDEEIKCAINRLVGEVEKLLLKEHPSVASTGSNIQEICSKGLINERQVLAAITQVLYHQRHIAIMSAGNLDTLDIIKVLKNQCGNEVVVATIYQAVAKKFGVICELIAFPNHLFLSWESKKDGSNRNYKIDLKTGELHPRRSCPFSQNTNTIDTMYCPDSLLKYIISAFLMTMGEYKTWYTQNAVHLLDFLTSNPNNHNPYRNFHPYLLDNNHVPEILMTPFDLTYLRDEHLQVILLLTHLNKKSKPRTKERIAKIREHGIKYAVGMICCHKKYDYLCVIRDWHYTCHSEWQNRTEILNLQYGPSQPFYVVIAANQSDRYIAQENLVEIMQPNRMYHLEDIIAKEFTHFNGFSYVPNNEKNMEYPGDVLISEMYRNRAQLKVMDL